MNRSAPLIAGLLFAGLAFAADTEALVQKLRSSNPDERREAARALSDLGADAKGATKALTLALADRDRFVRRFAAQALGSIGPTAAGVATDPLGKLLSAPSETKEVQEAAATALGTMGAKGLDPLLTALKNKKLEDSVRQKAAESLGNLGDSATPAVPALIKALQDPALRAAAVGALGEIGLPAKGAEKDLRDLLENKQLKRDKGLRSSVQSSLKKIGGKLPASGKK